MSTEKKIQFGILLPITSRGSDCSTIIERLNRLNLSLKESERACPGITTKIFCGVDVTDELWDSGTSGATPLESNFPDWQVSGFPYRPGSICKIWNDLGREATEQGMDYTVLLGDDIEITEPRWLQIVHDHFQQMQADRNLPDGFGCICLNDQTFPGFPSFPVLGRLHWLAFGERMFPEIFVNQDADPFVYEVYRRWHACAFAPEARIRNSIGGSGSPRYKKERVLWRDDVLNHSVELTQQWLTAYCQRNHLPEPERAVVLDVVVPTYRLDMEYLHPIVSLPIPSETNVIFHVINDNPSHAQSNSLEEQLIKSVAGESWKIKCRRNEVNSGASVARNRGTDESGADWILYLDDDVIPDRDIIQQYVRAIQTAKKEGRLSKICGFVGDTYFPESSSNFHQAVTMSGINFFYGVAQQSFLPQSPWGVTANLLVRRTPLRFALSYPKGGGGEDIDFGVRLQREYNEDLIPVPLARCAHPWWNKGARCYHHFFHWAYGDGINKGDGQLIDKFPHLKYRTFPNIWEFLLGLYLVTVLLSLGGYFGGLYASVTYLFVVTVLLLLTEVACDVFYHMFFSRSWALPRVTGFRRMLIAMEACIAKNSTDLGRFVLYLRHCQGPLRQTGSCGLLWIFHRSGPGPGFGEFLRYRYDQDPASSVLEKRKSW